MSHPAHLRGDTWLAIEFPRLAMDLLTRGQGGQARDGALPIAVSDADARKPCILDGNPAATRLGIRKGMPVAAALGLVEGLCVGERDPVTEHATLERLADWCYQYSSQVSILAGRHALLLEAGASQRLFGTPEALATRLARRLEQLGFHVRIGSAPTPEAALLAALRGWHLAHPRDIPRQLGTLPLDALPTDAVPRDGLSRMGFQRIGDILRLPRKALARRQGPALVDYLDRLTGARPDPQRPWQPADHFRATLDLPAEVSSSQGLLFPLRRLVAELCGMLRATDRGVQQVRIQLRLRRGEETLSLGLQSPGRDEARFMLLLGERLERLRLIQPVRSMALEAEQLLPFRSQQEGLFGDNEASVHVEPLLERLSARLGEDAVRGLRGVPDHRPEHSWSLRAPAEKADCDALPHRPVWLYPRPEPCRITDYRLLAGPERIEAGWWDGRDCRRDYYVVRDAGGSTLWAFREYKPNPGWYVHGVFG